MEKKHSLIFDLPTLLRLGDLDIRRIAHNNPSFSVGSYFALLSKYKDDGPQAAEALARIASNTHGPDDFKILVDIKALLKDMGCKKIVFILNDIISAIEKNNLDFAVDCSKSILEDIDKLYSRIMSAEMLTSVISTDDPTNATDTKPLTVQALKIVLDKLDRDESSRKMRILAVDDSLDMLKTITSILHDDYKVYGIANSMMLEKVLLQIAPELFLLDYKMPQRSGFELIPIIRSFDEHKNTPIIIMTAMGTTDHLSASHSLGANDFIVKPIEESVLREKIKKHIVRKKLF